MRLGNVLVQANRLGERYYVAGPAFEAYAPDVDLGEFFVIGQANGDDHARVMRLLNQPLATMARR